MNILFSTNHPAQIHNFRLLAVELEKNGHKIFWMATEKDISKYLLNHYNITYDLMLKPSKSSFSKVIVLIKNTYQCIRFIRNNKIDLIISRVSPYLSLAGFLLVKYHITLADTESSGFYNKLFSQFASALLTAKSFKRQLRKDQIRFDGNIELFYLHPKRFTPLSKIDVVRFLGIDENQPYIIMRFVSWDAYHDKGLSGFTDDNKIKAVKELSKYSRVYITSEKLLPQELEPYKISIPPERMHDVLAYSKIFFGESATMASESAVLGRPAIFLDKNGRGYTDEEGEYGLVHNFNNSLADQDAAIQKGIELLQFSEFDNEATENHQNFMNNKIDVIAFMVWFVENYPESKKIMKENPDYQYKFA